MASIPAGFVNVTELSNHDFKEHILIGSFPERILNSQSAKRLLDLSLASVCLILLSPLFFLAALFIKLTDGGPVFFIQKRVGKNGIPFPFFKFRSMIVKAHAMKTKLQESNVHGTDSITFKLKKDPRVTWIGRILRRTSIDELPQLWNVLRGDMSLVGPRPALPEEVARYSLYESQRLDVLPGITCLWQIQGRSHLPFPEQVRLDLEYVQNRSFRYDIVLMLKTIPAVLSCHGAY